MYEMPVYVCVRSGCSGSGKFLTQLERGESKFGENGLAVLVNGRECIGGCGAESSIEVELSDGSIIQYADRENIRWDGEVLWHKIRAPDIVAAIIEAHKSQSNDQTPKRIQQ